MIVEPGRGVVQQIEIPKRRNFENFLTAYREFTKHHEATAKVHMWTAISTVAAALERKVWLERGYYKIFPNLYMFIIGAPGLVKKSTSTAVGVDLLRELPNVRIMAERVSASSLIESMSRAQTTFPLAGKAVKQSSIFCYASELTVFMEEVAGNTTDLLTTFYDCQPNDSEKPWIYETRAHGQIKIFGPCLNLLGCSTPAWLKRAIPADQMEGGFASRILFVIENELPDRFVAIPELRPELHQLRQKLVEDLLVINNLRGEVTMTPSAQKFFTDWYEVHMRAIHTKRTNQKFAGYYGRKATQIEKLAIIASVSEGDSLIVDARHVAKAVAWIETLEKNMLEGFALAGKNPLAETAMSVLRFIKEHKSASLSQLNARFFNDLDLNSLKQVLDQLVAMQQIRQEIAGGSRVQYVPRPDAPNLFSGEA